MSFRLAHTKENGFFQGPSFKLVYALDGFLVKEITTHTVKGVRWVDYQASVIQYLNNLVYEPLLGIICIDR